MSGLGFDDDVVIDDHVEPLASEQLSLVPDVDPHFARHAMISPEQLPLERRRMEVLEQSVTENVVDLVESADDRCGQALFEKLVLCHVGKHGEPGP
jgi:hypothetical protein